jgi:uncharacterized protein YceK
MNNLIKRIIAVMIVLCIGTLQLSGCAQINDLISQFSDEGGEVVHMWDDGYYYDNFMEANWKEPPIAASYPQNVIDLSSN